MRKAWHIVIDTDGDFYMKHGNWGIEHLTEIDIVIPGDKGNICGFIRGIKFVSFRDGDVLRAQDVVEEALEQMFNKGADSYSTMGNFKLNISETEILE